MMRLREGKCNNIHYCGHWVFPIDLNICSELCIILYSYKLRTFLSGIDHKVLQIFNISHEQILLSSIINLKWACFSYKIHVAVVILNIYKMYYGNE